MGIIDFKQLKNEGKTVIYKESKNKLKDSDWDLWGERESDDEHFYVYRKIVTIEQAEQYEREQMLN